MTREEERHIEEKIKARYRVKKRGWRRKLKKGGTTG